MLKITNSQDFLTRIRQAQPVAVTGAAPAPRQATALSPDQARVSTDIAAPGEAPLADGSEQLPDLWHLSPQQEARYRSAVKNIATARTPEELDKALLTAKNLASENPDQQEFKDLQARAQGAVDGVHQLNDAATKLAGSPTDRAAATAALLARGDAMVSDSPLAQQALSNVQSKLGDASPDTLAAQLQQEPDLSKYPAGMAADLVSLAGVPQVGAVLPKVADTLADKGVDLQAVKDQPALGQLLTVASDQGKVQGIVAGWAKQSLDKNLEGKNHDSVKQGLDGFKQEMQDIAQATGLADQVSAAAQQVAKDNKDEIDHVANKDKGFLDHLGDLAGDLTGALEDIGQVAGNVLKFGGQAIEEGMHLTGKVMEVSAHLTGEMAGGALDVVGAHGLADATRTGFDAAGKAEGSFMDGAGSAVSGTVTGVSQMLSNPGQTFEALKAIAKDPELLVEVGKAVIKDATKGDAAYTAGYIAGNLLPMLLTGGAAGGAEAAGSLVEKGASMLGTVVEKVGLEGAGKAVTEFGEKAATVITNIASKGGEADSALTERVLSRGSDAAQSAIRKQLEKEGVEATDEAVAARAAQLIQDGDVTQATLLTLPSPKAAEMFERSDSVLADSVSGIKGDLKDLKGALDPTARGSVVDLTKQGVKQLGEDFGPVVSNLAHGDLAAAAKAFAQATGRETAGVRQMFDLLAHGRFTEATAVGMFGQRGAIKIVGQVFRGAVVLKNGTRLITDPARFFENRLAKNLFLNASSTLSPVQRAALREAAANIKSHLLEAGATAG